MKKIIEIEDLDFYYPDGNAALKNISLNIFEGECVGIIGPNGAGKTTFLLHLNGILQGSARIKILNMSMNKQTLKLIRSKVGMVFQNPDDQLFFPTVYEDVAFGPINMDMSKEDVDRRVKHALNLVDMLKYEQHSSHHLSLGEKKRVSLATVLSLPCEILVLDEPTSNLDPRCRKNLIKLLKDLKVTKIVSGHDFDLMLSICSRVLFMDNGEVIADGKPKDILYNARLMGKYDFEVPLV